MIYNTRTQSNDATESQKVQSIEKESRDYLRCDH